MCWCFAVRRGFGVVAETQFMFHRGRYANAHEGQATIEAARSLPFLVDGVAIKVNAVGALAHVDPLLRDGLVCERSILDYG